MSEYELLLRTSFGRVYAAALRACGSEEEAAWAAQVAFLRAYSETGSSPPASPASA